MNTKELQKERQQIFTDIYDGRIPKRVPVTSSVVPEAAMEYLGMDIKAGQWDTDQLCDVMDKICEIVYADTAPVAPSLRNPLHYHILGSKGIVMSESGVMQHPEIHTLEADEYEEFNKDPYKFMCDVCLPRMCENLNGSTMHVAQVLSKAMQAKNSEDAKNRAAVTTLNEKYGYAIIPKGGFAEAPFDFLADFLRSFTGMMGDIRRKPQQVLEACEAVLPMMQKLLIPKNPSIYSTGFIPLHMAPYLNPKQFLKFYWPSFKKLIESMYEAGQGVDLFVEQDWTPYIDYLLELPGRIRMRVEFGDPKLFKEKLGKKHIITAMYPAVLLQTASKEKCVDKAKEILDILAPGGGYIFQLDKSIYSLKNGVLENLIAVNEYVRDNAIY